MNYSPDAASAAAALTIFWSVLTVVLIFEFAGIVVFYVLSGIGMSKLFRKVGVEPWAAWVPFFNCWRLLEVGGQPGWLAVLLWIPYARYVTMVFQGISVHKIGASMGKDSGWTVLGIFLPFVWGWILGDDKAPYAPATMAARGWKPPLAGYGSERGPYVPPAGP